MNKFIPRKGKGYWNRPMAYHKWDIKGKRVFIIKQDGKAWEVEVTIKDAQLC